MSPLFALSVNPAELVLRGTLVYWFLFLLFRFVLRRDVGTMGLADVLLLVLIADASQNAMSGGYESVTDGALLIGTIAAWNYLLDWAGYRYLWVRRLVEPSRLMLMRHGRPLLRNMHRELMTMDDLRSKLREHGINRLSEVKAAFMEPDGEISVIRHRDAEVADPAAAGRGKPPP